MKISFDVDSLEDAEEALSQCFAVVDVWRLLTGVDIDELKKEYVDAGLTNPIPAGVKSVGEPHTLATEEQLKRVAEQPEPPARRGRAKKKAEAPAAEVETPVAATPEETTTPPAAEQTELPLNEPQLSEEDAREKLRQLCVTKGVVWIRPILQQLGVARVAELSDAQVHEILHAAA
jgi:hypothetical protein